MVITSTTSRIEQRADELRADPGTTAEVKSFVADLTVEDEVAALVEFAGGDVAILVNNAGMAQTGVPGGFGPVKDQPYADWQRQLDITLSSAFLMSKAVLPGMSAAGYGRICMVTSVTGPLVTMPGTAAYSAAKGGMDGLMRALAVESGSDGITVNGV